MKKEGTLSKCGTCGESFYVSPCHRKAVNYCSLKCKGIAQTEWMKQDLATRFWSKVQKTESCWLWTGAMLKTGYGSIRVNHKAERAHRIAYELVNGPIPKGLLILHSCDNPRCVNPAHLRIGDKKQNTQDAIERGQHKIGEQNYNSKLSNADVIIIKASLAAGVTGRYLANKFNVNESTISSIKNHKRWKHL